jgi:hypothetical protein
MYQRDKCRKEFDEYANQAPINTSAKDFFLLASTWEDIKFLDPSNIKNNMCLLAPTN